jgi:hypothetical protein
MLGMTGVAAYPQKTVLETTAAMCSRDLR